MEQLELFPEGELQPIQKWLHVWTEAQRSRLRRPCGSCADSPNSHRGVVPHKEPLSGVQYLDSARQEHPDLPSS